MFGASVAALIGGERVLPRIGTYLGEVVLGHPAALWRSEWLFGPAPRSHGRGTDQRAHLVGDSTRRARAPSNRPRRCCSSSRAAARPLLPAWPFSRPLSSPWERRSVPPRGRGFRALGVRGAASWSPSLSAPCRFRRLPAGEAGHRDAHRHVVRGLESQPLPLSGRARARTARSEPRRLRSSR